MHVLNYWSIAKCGYAELTPELERQGYGEDDIIEGGVRCVVLWPVN